MTTTAPDKNITVILTRILNARPELVFNAWTDPKHVMEWWGPKNFTTPVCKLDLKEGRNMLIHMRAPDGTIYPMSGIYKEISKPKRLVFLSAALDENGAPMFEILNTVLFEEYEGKTKLTLTAMVTSQTPKAPPYLAGMETGWGQTLDRLETFVSFIKK